VNGHIDVDQALAAATADLIRAGDILRTAEAAGRATDTDRERVKAAQQAYRDARLAQIRHPLGDVA
jgi:hypothetical protein